MSFLDGITKKVGDAAKTAAKVSGDMVESTKLSMTISSEEDKIKKIYTEIGKILYEEYENDQRFNESIDGLCEQIVEIQKNIDNLKTKMSALKKVRVCPNCKSEVEISSKFCPKCGASMPSDTSSSVDEEAADVYEEVNVNTAEDETTKDEE
jgi:hypothetical protein